MDMDYIPKQDLTFYSTDGFEPVCQKFHDVYTEISNYESQDFHTEIENNKIQNFYNMLHEILLALHTYTGIMPVKLIETFFTDYIVFQNIADIINLNKIYCLEFDEEDGCDPESIDQSDQSNLKISLHIINNCSVKSKILLKEMLKHGIFIIIQCSFKFYHEQTKCIALTIFSNLFRNMPKEGELLFLNFFLDLVHVYFPQDDDDPNHYNHAKSHFIHSSITSIFVSLNKYPLIYADDDQEREIRNFFFEFFFACIINSYYDCLVASLNGILDFAERPEFILKMVEKQYFKLLIDNFNGDTNIERSHLYIKIFINFFIHANDSIMQLLQDLANSNINNFIRLLDDSEFELNVSLLLLTEISKRFPTSFIDFIQRGAFHLLSERLYESNFESKKMILDFISYSILSNVPQIIPEIIKFQFFDEMIQMIDSGIEGITDPLCYTDYLKSLLFALNVTPDVKIYLDTISAEEVFANYSPVNEEQTNLLMSIKAFYERE
ncbi:hypothetical protein TRFO_01338 [Tritrichomonas foetus]|uniref:Uncharacterized protein n=1 Tax=Tritrichomonas foetus TaxID=1144522 RepID=A0A1J4KCL6_9EUKA|nr:hypothetical protein TRFO_01338 [Tritrichomonas foetus]|eukprot:OHT07197.1 hypothetical protein TRFO_01338 [Tritrichomonas foetus]